MTASQGMRSMTERSPAASPAPTAVTASTNPVVIAAPVRSAARSRWARGAAAPTAVGCKKVLR